MLNEYREDLRVECEKFGVIKKVILFDVSSPSLKETKLRGDEYDLFITFRWDALCAFFYRDTRTA